MAYNSGGLIEASDYNGFVNSVNSTWGVGSGDRGYGQSNTLSTVPVSATVTATQWATLIARIDSMRQHQSGVNSGITQPTTGDIIAFINTLSSQISTADNNRLLRDVGTTSASTAFASGTWNGTVQAIRECNFSFVSSNAMRYFFNAGGNVSFNPASSSFSGNPKSDNWNNIKNSITTAVISSSNFWGLTTSWTTIQSESGSGADYNLNTLFLQAKLNAAPGSSTRLDVRAFFDDGSSDIWPEDEVLGTARVDATANQAATIYLANSWGSITGQNNVTVTQS